MLCVVCCYSVDAVHGCKDPKYDKFPNFRKLAAEACSVLMFFCVAHTFSVSLSQGKLLNDDWKPEQEAPGEL